MNIEKVIKTFEEFQVTLSNGKILVSISEEELKRLADEAEKKIAAKQKELAQEQELTNIRNQISFLLESRYPKITLNSMNGTIEEFKNIIGSSLRFRFYIKQKGDFNANCVDFFLTYLENRKLNNDLFVRKLHEYIDTIDLGWFEYQGLEASKPLANITSIELLGNNISEASKSALKNAVTNEIPRFFQSIENRRILIEEETKNKKKKKK